MDQMINAMDDDDPGLNKNDIEKRENQDEGQEEDGYRFDYEQLAKVSFFTKKNYKDDFSTRKTTLFKI
jgi:hypothetical protein